MASQRREYLEAGRIVGTHGVHGEVRVEPWCDEPSFLLGFSAWQVDGRDWAILRSRVHKHLVLAKMEGLDDVPAAQAMRDKIISIRRADVELPTGRFFIQDILGFAVLDDASGMAAGILTDIWQGVQDIYVVDGLDGRRLVPNVPEFIRHVDFEQECIRVAFIEGM